MKTGTIKGRAGLSALQTDLHLMFMPETALAAMANLNAEGSTMRVSTIGDQKIAFIGGGNMAVAIISGLIKKGVDPSQICAVEPNPDMAPRYFQRRRSHHPCFAIH